MSRALLAIVLVLSAVLGVAGPAGDAQAVERRAAIVVDANSRAVLFAEDADARRHPASLTKMMTLYMTFDALDRGRLRLRQALPVSARAAGQAPSSLGLRAGTTITVEDAILALVTRSANDVAVVLAEALGGSESEFARDMTARARMLGMRATTFKNASGLPNRHQVTTARDMATLALALLHDHRQYYHYFSTAEFSYNGRRHVNHNHLLGKFDGADGIKTGYIRASGFNLVASAERGGRRLIGVVFGGTSAQARDSEMRRLLEKGFSQPSRQTDIRTADAGSSAVEKVVDALNPITPAKATEIEQGSSDATVDAWAVQVGAFSRKSAAERQAEKAIAAVPHLLQQSKVSVETVRDKSSRLHRAKLIGLSEREARDACRQLQRKKLGCLVLTPTS